MNSQLDHLLEEYAELEREVQALVGALCRAHCELCSARCCRADICEEALDSPFLQALHKKEDLDSDRYGFQSECGCGLELGRPPVCYEFFCAEILAAQPDELSRDVLRILGHLPAYAGENARNGAHLAEIIQADQLEKINFQTLEKQLQHCFHALEIIQTFYNEGVLPETSRRSLYRIGVPSDD